MAKLKVGINGFGRIGRVLFRTAFEEADLDIVGINCVGDPKTYAHLLKYDSTYGLFDKEVFVEGDQLIVEGKNIPLYSTYDPGEIPWEKCGAEVILECSGAFKKRQDMEKHLQRGAKRVLVSAPFGEADLTVVYGVNHQMYDSKKHEVISNASCTTNCLAPLAKVLHEKFGIKNALMTTIHSYTNDQRVLDAAHKDLRRARTAGVNMIPTTTGAAKAVGLVLPELSGRIDGFAIRVPTPNVSLVDFNFSSDAALNAETINESLKEAARDDLKGVLACSSEPLVSCDFIGNSHSSIVDLSLTMVMAAKTANMAKVVSWYDNEMGFSQRMVDVLKYMNTQGI